MRVWYKEKRFKENSGFVDVCARFGNWISCDRPDTIKERVHILPCLCFGFNHSEVYAEFSWLNFSCWVWYRDWRRADAYEEKMMRKRKGYGNESSD